ncbi:hypothetical protein C2S51_009629 [Perilla frutescens var. frutescens]|nr:hypothetical protein C2S51_009629 [Perilla frutescens var. frutescens]
MGELKREGKPLRNPKPLSPSLKSQIAKSEGSEMATPPWLQTSHVASPRYRSDHSTLIITAFKNGSRSRVRSQPGTHPNEEKHRY